MAYDETLAARIRDVIDDISGEVTERKMFGGLAFMLNGHMFTGVVGDELMLRLGDVGAEAALHREHVREMDFTGRPMKAMVFVERPAWTGTRSANGSPAPPPSRSHFRRNPGDQAARVSCGPVGIHAPPAVPGPAGAGDREGCSEFAATLSDAQIIRF